jgi:Tol biopolymer transport system component/DNA-binding winged helix-turn-helix (wHTH) protein
MERKQKYLYEFGPFRLDEAEHLLLRAGEVVPLTPKAFEVLLALVKQPGRLLEKETLLQAVWPESFVEEKNLVDNISRLRKALGEGENGQKYIETVPKCGYRFVTPVRSITDHEMAPTGEGAVVVLQIPDNPARKITLSAQIKSRRWRILIASGLLIVAAAIPIYLSLKSRRQTPRVTRYTQVTSDGRLKRGAVVTDGARVYFSEQLGGQLVLAQVSSASGETVPVQPPLPSANLLAISPDRSKLLIRRDEGSAQDEPLWFVPVTGGSPYRLGEVIAHAATWTPDGEWITYANRGDMFQVRNDGSGWRKLLSVTGRIDWPRWSPDGTRLRFTVLDAKTRLPKLWESAADGANPHPLLPDWNKPEGECCGNWSADGKYFVFESARNRVSDIWVLWEDLGLFARAKREPVQLTFGPMNFHTPVPSADGSRIFVIGEQQRGELIRYDATTRQFVTHLSGLSAEGLNFSADGEWVSYVTYPEGDLWRSKVDGSERLQLSFPPLRARNPRWSPDGKRIAFTALLPGKPWKLQMVSKDGGSPQQLMPVEREESNPGWSPDGNSLVFDARTPGMRAIYLLDLRKNQVSTLPGGMAMFSPRWSPDGRYIVALPLDSRKLMLFDFTTQEWKELAQALASYPTWSRDGRYVYFTDQFGNGPGIRRARIADQKVEWMADVKEVRFVQTPFGSWFGLAPDDSPLVLRDIGIQDIYSLDLQMP